MNLGFDYPGARTGSFELGLISCLEKSVQISEQQQGQTRSNIISVAGHTCVGWR